MAANKQPITVEQLFKQKLANWCVFVTSKLPPQHEVHTKLLWLTNQSTDVQVKTLLSFLPPENVDEEVFLSEHIGKLGLVWDKMHKADRLKFQKYMQFFREITIDT